MFNNSSLLILAVFAFGFCAKSNASETDAFTLRYVQFESAAPAINAEVNRRIDLAIGSANGQSKCSVKSLDFWLGDQLRRYMYGMIDEYINSSDLVPKRKVDLDQSVYRYVSWFEDWPLHFGTMGFGNIIRAKNYLIGADKFGHFFDEGYKYYEQIKSGKPLSDVLAWGIGTENGGLGLAWHGTGVRSYADPVANFQGANFWSNILTPVMNESETKSFFVKTRYVTCQKTKEGSKWVRVRNFDINDYIDAGWDEGYNCNRFRNKEYAKDIGRGIKELENKTGKRFACPVVPSECVALTEKYGMYAPFLLSPECLKAGMKK